ncbi:branched-chain amino acid ABC transporter permease [Bradyrhizobium sp. 14AA]
MIKLSQLVFYGLSLGSLYGLIALGFVVVFKSTAVINLSHGAIVLISGYFIFLAGAGFLGLPFALAVLVALGGIILASTFIQYVLLERAAASSADTKLMITLGLYIVLVTMCEAWFGVGQVSMGVPLQGQVVIHGVHLDHIRIGAIAAAAVCVLGLSLFFSKSKIGLSMRTVAADPEVAETLGVDPQRVHALAWAIAATLGLVAVMFLGSLPGYGLQPATAQVAFRAFPAAVLGGMTSLPGAVVGGLIIGIVEVMIAGYQPALIPSLGSGFYIVSGYVAMILILLLRPQGLFGASLGERV